jgi:hypothetical protein
MRNIDMKLKDILLDKFIETSLFEMAYERKRANSFVDNISYTMIEHIVKMFVMPNAHYWNHWGKEINGWIRQIRSIRLKPKSKPLSRGDLIEGLIDGPEPNFKSIVNGLKFEYDNDKFEIPDNLPLLVQNCLVWIINEIVRTNNENSEDYIDIRNYFKS